GGRRLLGSGNRRAARCPRRTPRRRLVPGSRARAFPSGPVFAGVAADSCHRRKIRNQENRERGGYRIWFLDSPLAISSPLPSLPYSLAPCSTAPCIYTDLGTLPLSVCIH